MNVRLDQCRALLPHRRIEVLPSAGARNQNWGNDLAPIGYTPHKHEIPSGFWLAAMIWRDPAHLVQSLRTRIDHTRRNTAPMLVDLEAIDILRSIHRRSQFLLP